MAAKSGNPAKRAEQLRISQIGDFKNRLGGIQELPSGLIVKVKNPGGLQAFIGMGIIPNSLMGIIQKSLQTGKAPKPEEVLNGKGGMDETMLAELMKMQSDITQRVVVEPKLHDVPTEADVEAWNEENPNAPVSDPEELRRDDILYIDELPSDDKQFLFAWVSGGTRDLEEFRRQLAVNVAAVSAVADAQAGSVLGNGADAG